jgi:hypothetical protein
LPRIGFGEDSECAIVWDAPGENDAGLLVIHGAGIHEPISSLHEIVNPTLNRMRDERNLVSVTSIVIGLDEAKGGNYDGLIVEYTPEPNVIRPLPPPDEVRKLLVVEGYWDRSFAMPSVKEVSPWSGRHVSRMAYEIFIYHFRTLGSFIAAALVLGLLATAVAFSNREMLSTALALSAFFVAFVAALANVVDSWQKHEPHPQGQGGRWRYVFALAPAVPLMIYHLQRGLVMVITFAAMFILPVVTAIARLIATIPFLDWLARGLIASVETGLLVGPPTDVATISNNPVGSAGIQNRLRGALRELEARVKPGGTITVVAHSAGTPLAWWLLSEPTIHDRQRQLLREKRFRYRLITVGAALNWAKRGMDCTATCLDWPLVRWDELTRGGGRDAADQIVWINAHATWDPVSHGGVWTSEYAGAWATRDSLLEDEPTPSPPTPATAVRRSAWSRLGLLLFGLVGILLWLPALVLFKTIEFIRPHVDFLRAAPRPDPDPLKRSDPNVLMRSLGSPISAEHSEYFRNQQEFIPLLVTSIDGDVRWAQQDAAPSRRIPWANARAALLSALVRTRIIVFALPLFALGAGVADNVLITACPEQRTDTTWQRHFGHDLPGTLHSAIDDVPLLGDLTDNVCNRLWIEDFVIVVAVALFAYALIDVYTEFLWQALGRRVRTLDRCGDAVAPRLRRPSTWRAGFIPLLPALAVWLPTVLAPLLILPFNEMQLGFWILFAANATLMPFEAFWLDRCLRGIADPGAYPETQIPYGRLQDQPANT